MLAARAAGGGRLPRGLPASPAIEGLELPCEDGGGRASRLVRVRRAAAARVDRDGAIERCARRRAVQAVPAGDPPDELLPRALRPPRGRVPGLRGRPGALGRAAFLPELAESQVERVTEALAASEVIRTRAEKHGRARNAQLVGAGGFLLAAAKPAILWHRAIAIIAADFRLEVEYFVMGWTAYALIALGLPSSSRSQSRSARRPDSRLYPRSRGA